MPPSIISGQIVAIEMDKPLKKSVMIELYHTVSNNASKNITRTYSTSFSFGISLLDKSIHNAIYAIYGFVRLADEIVDTFHDFPKREILEEFKSDTYKALDRGISINPVLHLSNGGK